MPLLTQRSEHLSRDVTLEKKTEGETGFEISWKTEEASVCISYAKEKYLNNAFLEN